MMHGINFTPWPSSGTSRHLQSPMATDSNVGCWHLADVATDHINVGFWPLSDTRSSREAHGCTLRLES
jgi:hypothetical protein